MASKPWILVVRCDGYPTTEYPATVTFAAPNRAEFIVEYEQAFAKFEIPPEQEKAGFRPRLSEVRFASADSLKTKWSSADDFQVARGCD